MLYHSEISIPEKVKKQLPSGIIKLQYTHHAINASKNDRYGEIPVFKGLNLDNAKVIEIETENDKIEKVLYRCSWTDEKDVCIAVLIATGTVKTVWVNLKSDIHKTLDKSKYSK